MQISKPSSLPLDMVFYDKVGVLHDTKNDNFSVRVLFVYDDVHQSDIVHLFDELDTFQEHMDDMFPPQGSEFPFGNAKQKKSYVNGNLRLFVWNQTSGTNDVRHYMELNSACTLNDLLNHKDYKMPPNFTPIVHLVPKDSPIVSQFL